MSGFSGRGAMRETRYPYVLTAAPLCTLITQIGVIKPDMTAGLRHGRDRWEKNNNAPAAGSPSHASRPDRCLGDAHAEHGLAAVARHLSPAADARHRHIGFRFHA